MKLQETINKAVVQLEAFSLRYGVPSQFRPMDISDKIGGSPATVGRVQRQIVARLTERGFNVRYINKLFCFDRPLQLADSAGVVVARNIPEEPQSGAVFREPP